MAKVAIIGAGMSGAAAGRYLLDQGVDVTLLEKSRGVGGRMATRRVDALPRFDHGAQYFTVRDEGFREVVDQWQKQELVQTWGLGQPFGVYELTASETRNGERGQYSLRSETRLPTRYVGVPGMNAPCKSLAEGIPLRTMTRVGRIHRTDRGWRLLDEASQELGTFDGVIATPPAEQTVALLADSPELASHLASVELQPCWASLVTLPAPLPAPWLGAFVNQSLLSWVARNHTKPGRVSSPDGNEDLVLHAAPDWTARHWEQPPEWIVVEMLRELARVTGFAIADPVFQTAHRWKYAIPVDTTEARCFSDSTGTLVACGDWAGGPRVEGAFLSGRAAALSLLETLTNRSR